VSVIIKIGKWILALLAMLILTIYFGRAFYSRSLPDPGPEYRIEFDHEFKASQERETDWPDYLAIEERLAKELGEKVPGADRPDSQVDRYSVDSLTYPGNYDGNWNRSYEMTAASPRGVAVLLHGLTDSPYSMLSTAQALVGAGYSVVVPRMPGHGFAVGGLLQARWEDWGAAIRIAVRHAMQKPGADESLLLVGYSNGGLMAIDYAFGCGERDDLACPDALVLMSPAIDVSPLAALTNLHSAISWMPFFEKFQWESILPEIDPFKFTSFPKRAAWEIFRILGRTHKALAQPGKVARLPPILTFQSVVDNTVSARAIVTSLYGRLPANGSRLVVYDVNSNSTLLHLMKGEPVDPSRYFLSIAPQNFGVTVLRNRNSNDLAVDVLTLPAGQTDAVVTQTPFEWPRGIFSLSHIALPFRADDPVYGNGKHDSARQMIAFGALAPRGERGVMRLGSEYFLRMRYNPFFSFQQAKMIEWLDSLPKSPTTETEQP
jgi:alpha-beta hydrolase superfamily lysophospholipase